MEGSRGIDDVSSASVLAGELDHRFNAFTARAAKECLRNLPISISTMSGLVSRHFDDIALQHRLETGSATRRPTG
jgi:hypothetical protein